MKHFKIHICRNHNLYKHIIKLYFENEYYNTTKFKYQKVIQQV